MRKFFCRIVFCLLLLCLNRLHAQDLRFTQVIKNTAAQISDIAQDKQGYLWIATRDQGLKRYDGINFKVYTNDPRNPNSLASGLPNRLFIDAENMIWIGMVGSGLEKFDPATNTFTHFKHDTKSTFSLSNDTVVSILEDHLGDLWVGTLGGLSKIKDGKFQRFTTKDARAGPTSQVPFRVLSASTVETDPWRHGAAQASAVPTVSATAVPGSTAVPAATDWLITRQSVLG